MSQVSSFTVKCKNISCCTVWMCSQSRIYHPLGITHSHHMLKRTCWTIAAIKQQTGNTLIGRLKMRLCSHCRPPCFFSFFWRLLTYCIFLHLKLPLLLSVLQTSHDHDQTWVPNIKVEKWHDKWNEVGGINAGKRLGLKLQQLFSLSIILIIVMSNQLLIIITITVFNA